MAVITTKRGQRNTASRINLSVTHGWSDASGRFQTASGPEIGESLEAYLAREKPAGWDIVYPFKNSDGTPDFSRNNIACLPAYDRISDLFQTANVSRLPVFHSGRKRYEQPLHCRWLCRSGIYC